MARFIDRIRRPRLFGFTIFNVAMVVAIVGWGFFTARAASKVPAVGVYAVPEMLVGYTGMAILLGLFALGWVLWLVFILYHRRRR